MFRLTPVCKSQEIEVIEKSKNKGEKMKKAVVAVVNTEARVVELQRLRLIIDQQSSYEEIIECPYADIYDPPNFFQACNDEEICLETSWTFLINTEGEVILNEV